jgi:lysophospholipase L1-like esterase
LPSVIYAVPGIETNLYFDNVVLVLNPQNYVFDAVCDKGLQLEERWTFTPTDKDVGEYPIELTVRDESNARLARARSVVRVVPRDRDSGKPTTLLLVGASWTSYSIYPKHLLDLNAKDEHLHLKLIGSRGPKDAPATGDLRHEGYSGWTAQAFVTLHGPLSRSGQHKLETGSPFVYDDNGSKPHLDFARYCQQFSDGRGPDAITVHLIANDVFTATDQTIGERVDKMIGYYDELIEAFHRVRPETRIGVVLSTPPSRSQDGFRNYIGAGRQTRWQYRRNLHTALEQMIQHYAGREAEQVYLVPAFVNLDTQRHFPTWTAPADARSIDKITRVNNGTHPSTEGYSQIGDSIYCWLKAVTPVTPAERNEVGP